MFRFPSALCLAALTLLPALAQAQTTLPAPKLPVATNYRYWPVQFVQWVGPELPYAMIELDVDPNGKHPLLYVTLTDRATGKRIHYAENDALLAGAAAVGEEAHKVALGYEAADSEAAGAVTTVRFTMDDGKPLQWRFVQGSDISEQGSGLTPLPDAKMPTFAYREEAAVAGEGTALQVGSVVSTASVWTEISQPPYFVAYRGAESLGAHTLVILPATASWTVASAPASLSAGGVWELDDARGNHRSIHIDKVDGDHITATATSRFEPGVATTFEATRAGDGWAVSNLRFAPVRDGAKHSMTLQFSMPLAAATQSSQANLMAGKKAIASGTVTAGTLSFNTPAWLSGKAVPVQ